MDRAHIIGSLLSVLALGMLALVLNSLFQMRLAQTGAALPADSASQVPESASPDSVFADTWKNATLDTIQFGEPRAVFTNTGFIKIYEWLPDNRRLLIEIEDPTTKDPNAHYRVATLDVETKQVVDYGRRMDWSGRPPVWVEKAQGVAFVTWNTWAGESPKVLFGIAGDKMRTLDEQADASLAVDPRTGHLLYLKLGTPTNTLQVVDLVRSRAVISPLGQANLPWGQLRVDPTGRWLASFWGYLSRAPLYLADRDKGIVTQVEFESWWPLVATWSPDSRKLALALGNGYTLVSASKLALLNPETLKWHFTDLPAQFITELDWGPSSHFLLVRGVPPGFTMSDPYAFWLIDVTKGSSKEISYFPPNTFPDYPFMAWSKKGQLAWLKGVTNGFQVAITQVSPER